VSNQISGFQNNWPLLAIARTVIARQKTIKTAIVTFRITIRLRFTIRDLNQEISFELRDRRLLRRSSSEEAAVWYLEILEDEAE
jgi:hypothetical protein